MPSPAGNDVNLSAANVPAKRSPRAADASPPDQLHHKSAQSFAGGGQAASVGILPSYRTRAVHCDAPPPVPEDTHVSTGVMIRSANSRLALRLRWARAGHPARPLTATRTNTSPSGVEAVKDRSLSERTTIGRKSGVPRFGLVSSTPLAWRRTAGDADAPHRGSAALAHDRQQITHRRLHLMHDRQVVPRVNLVALACRGDLISNAVLWWQPHEYLGLISSVSHDFLMRYLGNSVLLCPLSARPVGADVAARYRWRRAGRGRGVGVAAGVAAGCWPASRVDGSIQPRKSDCAAEASDTTWSSCRPWRRSKQRCSDS